MSRLHPLARLCIAGFGLLVLLNVAGVFLALSYGVFLQVQSPGQAIEQTMQRTTQWVAESAIVLNLFVYPVGLLWLGICRAKFDKRSFVSLGLRRPRAASNLGRGVLAGFLAIAVIWAILWLSGTIVVNGWSEAARGPNVVFALLGWLLAFAAVGFFEEFVFRGYALHNLTDWLGWKWAVLVQATIFALIHLGNVAVAPADEKLAALGAMPAIFLIGVFFALSYRKTGSLWFPIGFHLAWNFSLGCLFSLPVSGIKTFQLLDVSSNTQSWLSGGTFGAEGSFFLLPVILALIWFMRQAPDHPQALFDLELVQPAAALPAVVAAPIAPVETGLTADEPDRENRYRTKFGTSEGFDDGMLRELRELQRKRETREAEARGESATQTQLETALLQPPVALADEAETVAEVAPVEAIAVESSEKSREPTPIVAEKVVAPTLEKPSATLEAETKVTESTKPKPQVATPPTASPKATEPQKIAAVEAPPDSSPVPAPPKKARPKW